MNPPPGIKGSLSRSLTVIDFDLCGERGPGEGGHVHGATDEVAYRTVIAYLVNIWRAIVVRTFSMEMEHIYRIMPFSKDLRAYIKENPGFRESLKLFNESRFVPFTRIVISGIHEFPFDQVLGIFCLDIELLGRQGRYPIFKQDYVVNHRNGRFTSYTRTKRETKDVKNISVFFQKYGRGQYYGTANGGAGDHHYFSPDDLPSDFREEAQELVQAHR